jgi:hypothetical protein
MAIFVFKPALKFGDLQRIKKAQFGIFRIAMQGLGQLRKYQEKVPIWLH